MDSRLITAPQKKSCFLLGPRGTGKTTWVKAAFPDSVYIDLLEGEIFIDLIANPQRLSSLILGDFNGLKTFLAGYPMAKARLIFVSTKRQPEGEIEIIPVVDALKNLRSLLSAGN